MSKQYQRSMYTSSPNDWKNIKPRDDTKAWGNQELNDIYYPEKDTSFMYTGIHRSGKGRSHSRLRERFGSSEKFIAATREVLNSQPFNIGANRQSKKVVSIEVESVSDELREDKAKIGSFNTRNCKSQLSLMKPPRKNEFKAYQESDDVYQASTSSQAYSALNEEFLKIKVSQASSRSYMNQSMCSTKPSARSTSQNFEVFNHLNSRNSRPVSSNEKILILKPKQVDYIVPSFRRINTFKSQNQARLPSAQSQLTLPSLNQPQYRSSSIRQNTKAHSAYSNQLFPEIIQKYL